MFKEFTSRGSRDWITILPALIDDYNNSMHRTINMTPAQADAHPSRVTLKHHVVKTRKIKFHVGDKVRISVYKGVFTKGYLPNWSTEIFTIIKVNKTTPSTFILQDYTGSPIAGGFYAEEIRKTIYRVAMDAFGGSPDSRLNKSIADMKEKFENELVTHVNLIEINDAKITALSGEFTKELAVIKSLKAQVNNVNMSIGELVKDTPYPVKSMKNMDTKFGTTVTCILRNPVGSGTINIFLPKSVQMGDGDIASYNIGNLPVVSLIYRGMNNRSFIIDFQ
ncbi:hypothetical protein QTP88_001314 [Uroleucon formosanum]